MAKGKKFNAAELHFEKKGKALNAEIASYKTKLTNAQNELALLKRKTSELETENIQLKDWVERLLEYTNLSEEDIRKACEADKEKAEALKSFNSIMGLAKGILYNS